MHEVATKHGSTKVHQYRLVDDGGTSFFAYCVDMSVDAQPGHNYELQNVDERVPDNDNDDDHLSVIPAVDVPPGNLETIPENDVPPGNLTTIPDMEVPLADVPYTGDTSAMWIALSLLSGGSLAALSLLGRKKKKA